MALDLTGEYIQPFSRATVCSALNDPNLLQQCIPGCESMDLVSETEFAVIARLAVGPVKAHFKGKVRLQDLEPPQVYTIVCEGEGHRRLCQGKCHVSTGRRGRRHQAELPCPGPDRRKARPTRAAAGCGDRKEDRELFFRQFCRGTCTETGMMTPEPVESRHRRRPSRDAGEYGRY